MLAMELSGIHIDHKMKVKWRFKSWQATRPDESKEGWLAKIKHEPGGEVYLTLVPQQASVVYGRSYTAFRVPYDAEIEVLN